MVLQIVESEPNLSLTFALFTQLPMGFVFLKALAHQCSLYV